MSLLSLSIPYIFLRSYGCSGLLLRKKVDLSAHLQAPPRKGGERLKL
jgi:hypothetical protein